MSAVRRQGLGERRPRRRGSGARAATAAALLPQHGLTAGEAGEELEQRAREDLVVEAVDDVLSLPLVDHQVRLFQHREVTRDGGLGQIEVAHDLAHVPFALLEQLEDLLAGRVGQCLEDLRDVALVGALPARGCRTPARTYRPGRRPGDFLARTGVRIGADGTARRELFGERGEVHAAFAACGGTDWASGGSHGRSQPL